MFEGNNFITNTNILSSNLKSQPQAAFLSPAFLEFLAGTENPLPTLRRCSHNQNSAVEVSVLIVTPRFLEFGVNLRS